jgi:hypothetical protein
MVLQLNFYDIRQQHSQFLAGNQTNSKKGTMKRVYSEEINLIQGELFWLLTSRQRERRKTLKNWINSEEHLKPREVLLPIQRESDQY